MASGPRLNIEQRQYIWELYQKKNPAPGHAFTEWAEKVAKQLRTSSGNIRTVVTRQRDAIDLHLEHQSHTHAQQLAESMGLSMVDVFRTIKRNLHATKRDLVYREEIAHAEEPEESLIEDNREGGRNGEAGKGITETNWEKGTRKLTGKRGRAIRLRQVATDEHGKFIYFEQPDAKAQLMAAEQLGKILAVNAPEDLNLNVTHTHTIDLSDEELKRELADAAEQLAKLQAIEIEAERIPEALGGGSRKTRRKRLPLLDAELHQDGGRTGRDGEPDQAVPGQALLQVGPSGIRQGDDALRGEEQDDDALLDGSGVGDAQDGDTSGDGSAGPV